MKFLLRALLGLMLSAAMVSAAQPFPEHNIDFIVPFSPGGGSDNLVRAMQPALAKALAGTIVIRNIAGGGGAVGYGRFVRSPPDGYTLTTTNNAIFTLAGFSNAPFTNNDFEHIARVAIMPYVLAVRKNAKWPNFKALQKDLLTSGKKLSVGFSGVGSSTHITAHAIANQLRLPFLFIPFGGGTAAVSSAMGGHIDAVVLNPAEILSAVNSDRLTPILSTGGEQIQSMPEVPIMRDLGYDFELYQWRGISAPKGLPQDIKQIYVEAIKQAVTDPTFIKAAEASGTEVKPLYGAELDIFIAHTENIIDPIIEAVKH